jgi:outer membrane protein OmpU
MKKLLLATTMLVGTAGFAAAEVTLSGDARMGIIDDFGDADIAFTSRARVSFNMSGETDGGLAFGASFRADNAEGASGGTAGSVFISGSFGKLSMGDVDGAALAATGHVSGVGLTGLGDLNESVYIGNGGSDDTTDSTPSDSVTGDPSVLYEYSAGALSFYLSASNPGFSSTDDINPGPGVFLVDTEGQAYGAGVSYSMGDYTVGMGYEQLTVDVAGVEVLNLDHITLGGSATFGGFTLKAVYGMADGEVLFSDFEGDQWAISADYSMDALTMTAFYNDSEELPNGREAWGLGGSYDLGGGASVVGGYVSNETANDDAYDIGVSFSF